MVYALKVGISVYTTEAGIADLCRYLMHTENRPVYVVIPHLKGSEDILVTVQLPVHDLHLRAPLRILLLQERSLRQFQTEDSRIQPEIKNSHAQTCSKDSRGLDYTRQLRALTYLIHKRLIIENIVFTFGHTSAKIYKISYSSIKNNNF